MKISAVILTHNEEKNISECLSYLSWCDERLVVDDNSSDKTREIAKKLGAKIFIHSLGNNFSEQRNFALEKATGEWIFFVDADEVISTLLKSEIELGIKNYELSINGYYIKREDYMWGKKLKYGETRDIWLLRLAKKNSGKWEGKVHEVWKVKGEVGELMSPILHYPHQSIAEFLKEINFYTTLRAEELFKQHVRVEWWDIIIYSRGKFIVNYIFKLGFLDGLEGLVIAIMMSFHSFLVRGKLWQLNNENKGR